VTEPGWISPAPPGERPGRRFLLGLVAVMAVALAVRVAFTVVVDP
jgi:hypothetical protein